jgi:Domain of unknown function (DUF1707)
MHAQVAASRTIARMTDAEQPTDRPASVLRASDSERERTATLLRDHAAAGRLTPEELDERLDGAYGARTVGDLERLAHDLPPASPPARRGRALDRPGARERALHAIGLVVLVNLACNAIWLASGTDGDWWPKWVLLVSAIRLAFQLWSALGPAARGPSGDEARLGRGGSGPARPQ